MGCYRYDPANYHGASAFLHALWQSAALRARVCGCTMAPASAPIGRSQFHERVDVSYRRAGGSLPVLGIRSTHRLRPRAADWQRACRNQRAVVIRRVVTITSIVRIRL